MSEKSQSLYPTLPNPDTLVETAGEKPSVIQNPTEERPRKSSYNESEEIASNFSFFLFSCFYNLFRVIKIIKLVTFKGK